MSPVETPVDVVKQFIANFERKQRNLTKRKSKLDAYRDQLNRGETLNEEQKKAVEGYDGVLQSLSVVQEVLVQSKDLVGDVEKCATAQDLQKETEHENYTLSFLHVQLCLMRLLFSLEQHDVRAAVVRASSDNSLRMLDAVRHLVLPPASDSWPSTGSSAVSSFPVLLQSDASVTAAAHHTLNLVLGRPIPIPVSGDYDGSHKKFNFKEARNLCLRLLATPAVRRSMQCTCRSDSRASSVQGEVAESPKVPLRPNEMFHHEPEVPTGFDCLQAPVAVTDTAGYQEPSDQLFEHQAPTILDQVIKPLGGTFNFLQASSVLASDPVVEIPAPCTQVLNDPHENNGTSDIRDSYQPLSSGCYVPHSPATPEMLYNAEPESDIVDHIENTTSHEPDTMRPLEHNPVVLEPDLSSAPAKPMSYADLVRRSGFSRSIGHQQESSSGVTHEMRKAEHPVSESHTVYDAGDAENIHPAANWNRGGRGFNRGFGRGNQGPSRRGVGGARWGRIGTGAGRGGGGGGGPYRGAPPSIAQAS